MRLYTCAFTRLDFPERISMHPCARAMRALEAAGHEYELDAVGGFVRLPWTTKGTRDEVERLSGQKAVPILVLDDGEVISGSGAIVHWAKTHSPAAPNPAV